MRRLESSLSFQTGIESGTKCTFTHGSSLPGYQVKLVNYPESVLCLKTSEGLLLKFKCVSNACDTSLKTSTF